MAEHNLSSTLQEQVRSALANPDGRGLQVQGAASRTQLLPPQSAAGPGNTATVVDTSGHCGVLEYQPDELVLRARAGTPLAELDSLLAGHGQQFAAAMPQPGAASTLGGAIACGWDGPARPYGLSVRDALLGCRMINGRGDIVSFGGQVMKNVAGYDLARMQVGALGTLGVLLDVSLRLAPRPECTASRVFEVRPADLPGWWQRARGLRPLLQGTCYVDGRLHLRLRGWESAVKAALGSLGGEESTLDWQALTDLQHRCFCAESLACLQLPPHTPFDPTGTGADWAQVLLEWEGARVWVRDGDHARLQQQARELGGYLQVFRGEQLSAEVQAQVPAQEWQRRLRRAFDPQGLFNHSLYIHHFHGTGG